MTDMDKLITTIRDGAWKSDHISLPTWHLVFEAKLGIHADAIHAAYCGSLDVAKRLHDALLPGWDFTLYSCDARPWAKVQNDGGAIERQGQGDTHARAWLLAILRAYQEKEGGE